MILIYTLEEVKNKIIGERNTPKKDNYELRIIEWGMKNTPISKQTKSMGIQNKEGLQLISSQIIQPEQINTKEFLDLDVLGVKITTPLDDHLVFQELRKSFGEDVLKHPSASRRYVILNWRSHFNKTMI